MCGIAGIVRFDGKPIERGRAYAMLGHIKHRGPDGEGVREHDRCTLIHTRLSIIDIADGSQPMTAGDLTVTFNGEIYNHRDLRRELESLGHTFKSDHSDTEVLLHGYHQWGSDLPGKLEGMFAFAIWNAETRRLFLARDRMGKKPLYIRCHDREMIFASLVGTLAQGPIEIDPDAMRMFLRLGYTDGQSLIKDVAELPPGHWMMVDPSGRARQHGYWRAPLPSETAVADTLMDALEQAVSCRLEADVELGCFLSGGIDSSVVAAIAQRQLHAQGQRLKTFSVKMPVQDYDESEHALAVARHIGSDHTQLAAQPGADLIDDLSRIIAITGEPTADSSILPTYWLSTATRQHVKVALSGDGGDELFAGYDRYRAMRMLQTHRWWLRWIPQMLLKNANPRSTRTRLGRLVDAAQMRQPAEQYQSMIHLFSDHHINELGMTASSQRYAPVPDWLSRGDSLQAARHWDMAYYLPMDLLRKVDRASMAVALEVRCPLLDTRVVELAAALPTRRLIPGGAGGRPKHVLREIAAQLVPSSIVDRPKRGFAIPVGQWFNESLRTPLADHLFSGRLDTLGFERATVQRFYDEHTQGRADHTHRLFALLELALWGDWLKGLS